MRIRQRGALYLALLAAAALLPLIASRHEQAASTPVATATSAANAMAVDAVPGGAIDSTRTVTNTAPFEVNIVITSAPTPYRGYGYRLGWDPAVLAFETAMELEPAELPSCPKPVPERNSVWGSCIETDAGVQFVGPVAMVRFHCVTDGVSPLHVVTAAENPLATSTFDALGYNIDTTLTDASVACQNVGPPAALVPLANDNFANAKAVPGLPFSDSLSTAGATREQGEEDLCHMGRGTVWYSFTPSTTRFVQADTLGSNFDTVLAVYTGPSLGSLAIVDCNDDMEGLQSKVTAELAGGTTYYFQVGGPHGYRGSLVFNLKEVPPPPQPPSMPNAIAVDAISGGGIDPARTVTGVTPFDLDIYITSASHPYQGYQYMLQWDPRILAYDGQENLRPAGLSLCAKPTTTDSTVYAGCARVNSETQFVGPVNTARLYCIADGTSRLHLRTTAEEFAFFSVTIDQNGRMIGSILTDASITCRGTGKAAPSAAPTPLPVAPVTGTGGFLEDR